MVKMLATSLRVRKMIVHDSECIDRVFRCFFTQGTGLLASEREGQKLRFVSESLGRNSCSRGRLRRLDRQLSTIFLLLPQRLGGLGLLDE